MTRSRAGSGITDSSGLVPSRVWCGAAPTISGDTGWSVAVLTAAFSACQIVAALADAALISLASMPARAS
ncbi:hypothetical protein [Saccharopolyspora hattusasensis]|uniref:hypothetical protein n=1 Tax=Saccharopolyspora hattusasensis TaxID=1128679 RepID=UPI003D976B92